MNKELNSIGINKKPEDTTVVVAMSGGVDSSTVAGIMKVEGYKVIKLKEKSLFSVIPEFLLERQR